MKELKLFDVVEHQGKAKTVVALSLSMACLDERTPEEIKQIEPRKFNYGPWIDRQFIM